MQFIEIDRDRAISIAKLLLAGEDIEIIPESINAIYRTRKLGFGELSRGWAVFAKLNLSRNFDPDSVTVYVSDSDEKAMISPIL